MPRTARKKSESGIYHVLLRGINKQLIFEDDEDCKKYLQVITLCQKKGEFKLLVYCLMGNHLHLLIKEEKENLEQIFKRIGVRYVYWYNKKYNRLGHLFQDRFKSEPIEDDSYFLTVLRYIHQNPIKAGLCKNMTQYKWSSYHDYLSGTGITDTEFGLALFHENIDKAKAFFVIYMDDEEITECFEFQANHKRLTDKEAQEIIRKECGIGNIAQFQSMEKIARNRNLALLKKKGLSIRQIVRSTGVSFSVVRSA